MSARSNRFQELMWRALEDRRQYESEVARRQEHARWLDQQRCQQQNHAWLLEQARKRSEHLRLVQQQQQQQQFEQQQQQQQRRNKHRKHKPAAQACVQAESATGQGQGNAHKRPRIGGAHERLDSVRRVEAEVTPAATEEREVDQVASAREKSMQGQSKLRTERTAVEAKAESDQQREGTSANPQPSNINARKAMALKNDDSCQHLARCLQKGRPYLSGETASYNELITMQESARNVLERVDRSLHASRNRERKSLFLEKSDALRQRDVALEEVSAVQREMAKLRQDQEAEIAGLKQAHQLELDNMRNSFENEIFKATCKICRRRPRDAVLLPCMHFDYCSICLLEHQTHQKTCPRCSNPVQGVLKCHIAT